MSPYLHVKSNEVYQVISEKITNATNKDSGNIMVLYANEVGELFVREISEFKNKFTPMEG